MRESMRKNVGVLFGLLVLGVILLSAGVAFAWTLSWSPVNTYADNTAIEPGKTVLYNVERNGAVVSPQQNATEYVFTTGHKTNETFRVQTELSTGEVSAWSAPFLWESPAGIPKSPSGLSVH